MSHKTEIGVGLIIQNLNTYELETNFPCNDPVSSEDLKEIDEELILFGLCVVIEFTQWIWIGISL